MENIVYQGVRGKHGEQVLGHGETDMYLIKSNIEKKASVVVMYWSCQSNIQEKR
tara:strand:+ start:35 stop:196 length:162 start_codon:yes stop_codon:yes gene_type:complete